VIYELGHVALILALAMALAQSVLPLVGAQTGNVAWMSLARPSARGQFLFLAIAYGCLTHAFITNDFSVALAANHSNSNLPLVFRITAVWGNHEGSILLWALILAGWTLAVSIFSRQLDDRMVARVLGVMGLVSCGFLLFTLFTSNPFERLFPVPRRRPGPEPAAAGCRHGDPPADALYGICRVCRGFCLCRVGLLSGRLDAAWARWSRPWTTVAWCFLTCGIALGSFWAYYELGWGGWWFWDPVENASFMPWLVGTALIHSLAVTEKRGGFKMWTALLAIMAFSLSLLGTFIVRSGVLSSVHAFATDPARGVFILAFLALVVGGSLVLFALRAPKVGLGGSFEMVSRESMLLANNVLLVVAAAAVLLGTLYPLVIDALGMGKLSVGPPYFDAVFVPLMAPALFLMGVGPMARWRKAEVGDLTKRLRWAIGVSLVSAVLAYLSLGHWTPMVGFGLLLAVWIASTAVLNLVEKLREHPAPTVWRRLSAQTGSYFGMVLAHFGVAVFIVGVTMVSGFETESDVRMEVGDTASVAGYTFRLESVTPIRGPNYNASRAKVTAMQDGKVLSTLSPERRVYTVRGMPMTEVGIDRGITRDLYVALGDPVSATAWSVRLHHKPFVNLIWIGCLLMAIGGLLAVLDRRYRRQPAAAREKAPAANPGPAARPAQPAMNHKAPAR
jgi:cytochrome c-type biogenesis protein CcmF